MAFKPLFGSHMLYGADYNPEQWLAYPEVLEADVKMMQQAHCNVMSVGIFSWAKLEPEEGKFDFTWMDEVLDRLHAHGVKVFLATPSGARPVWLAQKYPEVLRVNERREKQLFGARHNHCMTSPIYREKVALIDSKLAERYGHHPAVLGWHLSNEYGGQCHCPLCQQKFRHFLQKKYGTLEKLNEQWWNTFWSHTMFSWEQIESPSPIGENAVHGLNLDWMRFSSANALDFCRFERDVVKKANPDLPVTTNFMEFFRDYDYFEWASSLDFISWDSYPQWNVFDDPDYIASYAAMNHDLMRSLKGGQPFVLMESTPSCTNWRPLSVLKRPGMNIVSSLQAVAHGADSVQYFQWRKSRGSSEKFHGAVVDHVGHIDTRVGREVQELGSILSRLGAICGAAVDAKVALVFDTPNRWAIEDAQGPRNQGVNYLETCLDYYRPLFKRGIAIDVIDETCPLDKYEMVIAPLSYMLREGYADKVKHFVSKGGTYIASCWSGIVNENDQCFLGGFPGPLREVMGIWEEEIDSLPEGKQVKVQLNPNGLDYGFVNGSYYGRELCGLAHAESGTEVLLSYASEFYHDYPVITRHQYRHGQAYYVATRLDAAAMDAFLGLVAQKLKLKNALNEKAYLLPPGLNIASRVQEKERFIFINNYDTQEHFIKLNSVFEDMLPAPGKGKNLAGVITIGPMSSRVLRQPL